MVKLTLRRERCKACGLCIKHCPKGTLQEGEDLNELGYHAVVQLDPEKCTGCGLCAVMCPDVCIDVRKTAEAAREVAR